MKTFSQWNENQKMALQKKLQKVSATSAKGKAAVTLPKMPWDKDKDNEKKEGMTFMKPGPEKDKFHKDAKAKASAKIKDMIKKGEVNFKSQKEGKAYGPTGISYSVPKGHPDEVDPKTGQKKNTAPKKPMKLPKPGSKKWKDLVGQMRSAAGFNK